MATSGTAVFNLDVLDLIEEAYERAGGSARTGNDYRTARRSLNLLSAEWSNRGLNLWTVEPLAISMTTGVSTYTLPADTIDVVEATVSVGGVGTAYPIARIGVGDYARIPNKTATGRPLQLYVQRTIAPTALVWPVPDGAYTLSYWRLRRMQDATAGSDNMDIPVRFLPALTAGLAFHLAQKRPEAAAMLPFLQGEYERQFALAADEDHGREAFFMSPQPGYP